MRLRIFFLLLLFCFPLSTGAVSPSSISINVAPANPAPNEDVTITLGSYSSNLDGATISWSVNGKTAVSGVVPPDGANAPVAGGRFLCAALLQGQGPAHRREFGKNRGPAGNKKRLRQCEPQKSDLRLAQKLLQRPERFRLRQELLSSRHRLFR